MLLNPNRLQKMIQAMHMKIDNIRNKFNYSNSENNDLKVEIDKVRRELKLYRQIKEILIRKIENDCKEVEIQKQYVKDKEEKMEKEIKQVKK